MKTRIQGASLLAVCAVALHRLYLFRSMPPIHQPTMGELVLGFVVIVTGIVGAMMLGIGHELFEPYEWPPKR